MISYDSNKVKL